MNKPSEQWAVGGEWWEVSVERQTVGGQQWEASGGRQAVEGRKWEVGRNWWARPRGYLTELPYLATQGVVEI